MRLGFELTRSEFTEKVNECIYFARKVCETVSDFEKNCEMVTTISYAHSFHEFFTTINERQYSYDSQKHLNFEWIDS